MSDGVKDDRCIIVRFIGTSFVMLMYLRSAIIMFPDLSKIPLLELTSSKMSFRNVRYREDDDIRSYTWLQEGIKRNTSRETGGARPQEHVSV